MRQNPILIGVFTLFCLSCLSDIRAQSVQDTGKLLKELASLPDLVPSDLRCVGLAELFQKAPAAEIVDVRSLLDEQLDSPLSQAGQRCSVMLLYAMSQRADGAELLAPETSRINHLVASDEPGYSNMAKVIVQGLTHTYPQAVTLTSPGEAFLPALEADLRRIDAPSRSGAGTMALLLHISQNAPSVVDEVVAYMRRRDLPDAERYSIANTIELLGNPPAPIVRVLIEYLDSPIEDVRLRSIGAIARGGLGAIQMARPRLGEIAADSQQPEQVRRAAQATLSQ